MSIVFIYYWAAISTIRFQMTNGELTVTDRVCQQKSTFFKKFMKKWPPKIAQSSLTFSSGRTGEIENFNFGMQIADLGFCVSDMFDFSICNPQSKIRN